MKLNEHTGLERAIVASGNSPCRSKRGIAIWNHGRLVAIGWNDQPRGFVCDGSDRCKATCGKTAVHAEQMGLVMCNGSQLIGADLLHVKTVGGKPVASGPPSCLECSKLIAFSGIANVWLLRDDGLKRYTAAEFHRLTLEHHARKSPLYWIEKGR